MRLWSPNLQYNKTEIWINDPSAGSDTRRDGSNQVVTGIDLFANVVSHENRHVQQIGQADTLLGNLYGQANTIWASGWSWNFTPNNHWRLGADSQPGMAGVDDDGDGLIDERNDNSEVGFSGSDDVDLDLDDDDVPNAWEPATLEGQAGNAETISEHTNWQSDWASPGKQHATNQVYND